MTKNKLKMWEKALCLIFALIFSINSFAAVVSDNDGAAFVTKAEFEALKKNFENQIEQYNTSIDSKIDGAIASYLAGVNVSKKVELDNVYDKLGCGKRWVWGNNSGTRTEWPYGGCNVLYWKTDTLAQRYGTATYNYNSYDNILFLGDDTTNTIGEQPYKYTIYVNERDWDHYYQNAGAINSDRSFNQYVGWNVVKRNGEPYFNYQFMNAGSRESHMQLGSIIELYEKSTTMGVFSINNAGTEYYIIQAGDEDAAIVSIENYSGKGTTTGNFPNNNNQTWKKKWRPSWCKTGTHNQLRVSEWEAYTKNFEKIISGVPVASIDRNETNVEIKYKTNKAGKLYIYDSTSPIEYNLLVSGELVKIETVTELDKELTIKLENCVKDSWIRVMFLPDSGTANLEIISVEAEVM